MVLKTRLLQNEAYFLLNRLGISAFLGCQARRVDRLCCLLELCKSIELCVQDRQAFRLQYACLLDEFCLEFLNFQLQLQFLGIVYPEDASYYTLEHSVD